VIETLVPDPRFFECQEPLNLVQIQKLGGVLAIIDPNDKAESVEITHALPLQIARSGSISFFEDKTWLKELAQTKAGFVFITDEHKSHLPEHSVGLIVKYPKRLLLVSVKCFIGLKTTKDLRRTTLV